MRKIDPAATTAEQRKAKSEELDRAWKTIIAAGPKGAAALKEECKKIAASREKDDFLVLGAAALLWQIGRVDEAGTIATLWSGDVDLNTNYNYVFYTAFAAAQTQDPRVLPMLTAILKDQRGEVFVPQHALTIAWPLSHACIWGAFGSKAAPGLLRVLDEAKDESTPASAIGLLASSQDLAALEKIRAIARAKTGTVRATAEMALGRFGHPQDFDLIAAGLKSKDPREVWALPLLYTSTRIYGRFRTSFPCWRQGTRER
jgi:HEAT repeat protein